MLSPAEHAVRYFDMADLPPGDSEQLRSSGIHGRKLGVYTIFKI
jgi:hypothetical protein